MRRETLVGSDVSLTVTEMARLPQKVAHLNIKLMVSCFCFMFH